MQYKNLGVSNMKKKNLTTTKTIILVYKLKVQKVKLIKNLYMINIILIHSISNSNLGLQWMIIRNNRFQNLEFLFLKSIKSILIIHYKISNMCLVRKENKIHFVKNILIQHLKRIVNHKLIKLFRIK